MLRVRVRDLQKELASAGGCANRQAKLLHVHIMYVYMWARLPPQILAFLGKDKFDMFNISAI